MINERLSKFNIQNIHPKIPLPYFQTIQPPPPPLHILKRPFGLYLPNLHLLFNDPSSTTPYTSVLRKDNFKYDIIPENSNVNDHYKLMAGSTYFRTTRTHSSSKIEQQNQFKVVTAILKLKGFSKSKIRRMSNQHRQPRLCSHAKKFLGTTTLNKISLRHHYVKKVVKHSGIDLNSFYIPMEVPGPKLEQYIFTIKKMRKTLNF